MRGEHGIQCMPCSFRIISEMQPIIHTVEKFGFLKSIIHSQMLLFSVASHKFLPFVINAETCGGFPYILTLCINKRLYSRETYGLQHTNL